MNDKGCRADRYHIAVVEQGSFAVAQQFVAEECAGEAGVVSHGEYGAPAFFLDVDDAVPAVHAHVAGLDGDVDLGTFRGSPDDVVTEVEWKFLSVSERVFQYGDVAERGVGVVSMSLVDLGECRDESFAARRADKRDVARVVVARLVERE